MAGLAGYSSCNSSGCMEGWLCRRPHSAGAIALGNLVLSLLIASDNLGDMVGICMQRRALILQVLRRKPTPRKRWRCCGHNAPEHQPLAAARQVGHENFTFGGVRLIPAGQKNPCGIGPTSGRQETGA